MRGIKMNPKYPIFIPSKGRSDTCMTMRALDRIGVSYTVVVEPQEVDPYARAVGSDRLLVTPHRDEGLVVTRNWIWDYALASGTPYFWTMDDNISGFYRFNRNLKTPVASGTILRCAEDFAERYENVPIAGMNYFMFVKRKDGAVPPYYLNTRVYSNMLIKTDIPFRNEGFYNDDTDLCLRVLKAGFCTILFNAFLILKATTMTVEGGMTPHYRQDGRRKFAEELRDKHPDLVTVSWKFGRWHHSVDYRHFRRHNKLKLRAGALDGLERIDNYGMVFQRRNEDGEWRTEQPQAQRSTTGPDSESPEPGGAGCPGDILKG